MQSRVFYCVVVGIALALGVVNTNAQVLFIPNQNQWSSEVLYRAETGSGAVFFGEDKITYAHYSVEDVLKIHEQSHEGSDSGYFEKGDEAVRCFAYQTSFVGGQFGIPHLDEQKSYRANYFLGNDDSKWATNVPVYGSLSYQDIYPGIDVRYYGEHNQLKYDFIVSAGADAAQIRIKYDGQNKLYLFGNKLCIDIGFTTIEEVIPSAYQIINGVKRDVNCSYVLNGNEVSYAFPDGYDRSAELIIDPLVVAATYSGGTGTTGAFCATYDEEGNLYSGGDGFSLGMPVSPGAYSSTFAGMTDLAISKYNPDGSSLLYCTYIGGTGYDFPHNLFASQGKLYIMGATLSGDFPVTAQTYDSVLEGISDIYVCCLDNSGSNLLGSTYVGGNWGDGTSMFTPFYPDRYRGELRVASNGDVLVCSTTMSTNFPATPGAYRTTIVGGQDAVILRMNSSLTSMVWATYLGSGTHDVAWGIREASDGSIYVCGATNNRLGAFPTVPGCYNTTPMGGADAYVAHLDANGSTLLASTYFGGNEVDAAYYIDLDKDGDVYICGYTRGSVPVTDGVFYCQNAGNFVAKFNSSLTQLMYSTVIGAATSTPQLTMNGPPVPPGPPPMTGPNPLRANNNALTAFKVDECERVYIGAYVGSSRWPLTDDTLYSYSADNQFCVLVLEEDAVALLTSTMYSGLHVDGGSGHFDDHGVLYQVACVRTDQYFMTTPWAFSDSTNSGAYDICAFKINMYVDLIDSVTFPNVFTPNNDGLNDQFEIGEVTTNFFDLTIYDRNGAKVFYTTDVNQGWDGTFNGRDCAEGVYYYAIRYYFCTQTREKAGFVHLQR